MERGFLKTILRSQKTVFSFKDLVLMWGDVDAKTARTRLSYYVKTGALHRIRRGLYAKDKNYDRFEMATKIFIPSYISFQTVLLKEGMIFQYYQTLFVASYQSKELVCDGHNIVFRRIKESILLDKKGLVDAGNYFIASVERAYLDSIYLDKNGYFDNLTVLNWDKVFEILPIYNNKRMEREVMKNHKYYKESR